MTDEIKLEPMTDEQATSLLSYIEERESERLEEARRDGRQIITEEDNKDVIDEWWAFAEGCASIDDAAAFAKRLSDDYCHDYGTVCHAIAAAGVAMANAVSRPQGITWFQGSAVGWMLHSHWMRWGDEPRRMLDLSNLLYPQYDDQWTRVSPSTQEWLVEKAKRLLAENHHPMSSVVRERWELVASGQLPDFVQVTQ